MTNSRYFPGGASIWLDGAVISRFLPERLNGSSMKRCSMLKLCITVNPAWTIKRVTLIKTGSVTHSCNFEQRFMELSFTATASGLSVTAPTGPTVAPPGYYMVFAFNNQGVPSIAHIIRIG